MEAELNLLEERIVTLTLLCQKIREENHDLLTQLQAEREQNSLLSGKIVSASERLEQLLSRLPEDA
ncbi:hypothetical protein LIN78_04210 [Leeia sp. TBRC 13508]|uniref:Cell division protein ZapB n=1 Tax=Leeia speluncae TaxID=2884804 RepID=A0ABS8D3N6_9NEIS|nr:hypothetical protein [Leeia speluncae]MCB6182757.1 hypothetical protein [Leeia speluncae]